MQHRCLDLDEAAGIQRVADRSHRIGAHSHSAPGRITDDEIEVALTNPGFLGQLLVHDRKGLSPLAAIRHSGLVQTAPHAAS